MRWALVGARAALAAVAALAGCSDDGDEPLGSEVERVQELAGEVSDTSCPLIEVEAVTAAFEALGVGDLEVRGSRARDDPERLEVDCEFAGPRGGVEPPTELRVFVALSAELDSRERIDDDEADDSGVDLGGGLRRSVGQDDLDERVVVYARRIGEGVVLVQRGEESPLEEGSTTPPSRPDDQLDGAARGLDEDLDDVLG